MDGEAKKWWPLGCGCVWVMSIAVVRSISLSRSKVNIWRKGQNISIKWFFHIHQSKSNQIKQATVSRIETEVKWETLVSLFPRMSRRWCINKETNIDFSLIYKPQVGKEDRRPRELTSNEQDRISKKSCVQVNMLAFFTKFNYERNVWWGWKSLRAILHGEYFCRWNSNNCKQSNIFYTFKVVKLMKNLSKIVCIFCGITCSADGLLQMLQFLKFPLSKWYIHREGPKVILLYLNLREHMVRILNHD